MLYQSNQKDRMKRDNVCRALPLAQGFHSFRQDVELVEEVLCIQLFLIFQVISLLKQLFPSALVVFVNLVLFKWAEE